MPYATASDMQLRLGPAELQQLTDTQIPRLGDTNEAVLTAALDDATAMINGYIMGRYTLPITDANALAALRPHCCSIARFTLMSQSADEQAIKAYDQAIAYLTAVGKGTILLIAPADVPEPVGVGTVQFNPGTKHFGRDC